MADLHFHACSTCSQSFECELEIGTCGTVCSGCSEKPGKPYCSFAMPKGLICTLVKGHGGKEHIAHGTEDKIAGRCPVSSSTSGKYRKPATRGYFLCDTGWICRCGEFGTKEQSECPSCGRPKPTQDGHEYDFDLAKVVAEEVAGQEVEKAEAKSWTCPNCGNDYSGDSAEDDHSQSCHIKSCDGQLCDKCSYVCDDCEHSMCEDHHYSCQCCSHSVCYNCRDNHGA